VNRTRGIAVLLSYWIATAVGFYFVSTPHNWFIALFGTFVVAFLASVVFAAMTVVIRLFGAGKNRS
jgi:hypothetical protein